MTTLPEIQNLPAAYGLDHLVLAVSSRAHLSSAFTNRASLHAIIAGDEFRIGPIKPFAQ